MFVDAGDYPFLQDLEAAYPEIRAEAQALPEALIEPWVEKHLYGTGWSLAGLNMFGRAIAPMCARCPTTARLLAGIPGLAMATFSRLAPHAHIEEHTGWGDRVYRFHLGLVVPPGCALRVGDETREWQEGKCLGFDDTVPHEAWNRSDQERWVLMLDVLRPGLRGEPYDMHKLPIELLQRLKDWFPDVQPELGKVRTAENES